MDDRGKYIVKLETGSGPNYLQSFTAKTIKLTKVKSEAHQFDSRAEAQQFIDNLPAETRLYTSVEPAP